jgi:hypothetical protein
MLIVTGLDIYLNFQAQQKFVSNEQQLIAQNAANTVNNLFHEKFILMVASSSVGRLATGRQEEQKAAMEKLLGYLDCGDLHNGFARVKCKDFNHEYLLAFSCKRRHFCPSCHQKRVVEFGEWLCANVLKRVPHRHFVFSLPKILRRHFLHDRKLLHDLSRCAWESLKFSCDEFSLTYQTLFHIVKPLKK